MITYEKFIPKKHYLTSLKRLVYSGEFSSTAKALGNAISDLIMEHVMFEHISPREDHTVETLIKKQYYLNDIEFLRTAVREFLKKKNSWPGKLD